MSMGFELRSSLRSLVIGPLSLALSRKGRGEVLFECIERFFKKQMALLPAPSRFE